MSNISRAFDGKKAFIGFVTGGDPDFDTSADIIVKMAEAGADVIEIGIPFSDPVAEGPVIQAANIRALSKGMTTDRMFELAGKVREKTDVPLVFLTYLNPVFKYGYEDFFKKCAEIGIDGVIIPDMPYEEKKEAKFYADRYEIDIITLIAPTSEDRIKMLAADAKGFIYLVSSMGVTGMRDKITTDIRSMVNIVRQASNVPVAVGFGINTPVQGAEIAGIADGVIVGSAIVKIVEEHGEDAPEYVYNYVQQMKQAVIKGI